MKNFENVYKELENLFINILPEYEKDKTIHLWRYIGVINKMLLEEKMKILNIFKLPKYKAQNFLLS